MPLRSAALSFVLILVTTRYKQGLLLLALLFVRVATLLLHLFVSLGSPEQHALMMVSYSERLVSSPSAVFWMLLLTRFNRLLIANQ